MFVVYSDSLSQKNYLQEEFLFESNYFAVPLSNAKSLHDLIDKTCYQFNQGSQSISIEKLKLLISGLIDLKFSFPLFRQLLSLLNKRDLITDLYRNQLIRMNQFFVQEENSSSLFQNKSCNKQKQIVEDQFQKVLINHQTSQLLELVSQPLTNLGSFGQYQQYLQKEITENHSDDKLSTFQSEHTNDETLEGFSHRNYSGNPTSQTIHTNNISDFVNPYKIQRQFNNLSTISPKITNKKLGKINLDSSMKDFINSFKKQRPSAVVQMLLNDQSMGKIVKKSSRSQKQVTKLWDQLHQKTEKLKSNEYNCNIKNVLMNKKLKDRKKTKPVCQGQNIGHPNVANAYEL